MQRQLLGIASQRGYLPKSAKLINKRNTKPSKFCNSLQARPCLKSSNECAVQDFMMSLAFSPVHKNGGNWPARHLEQTLLSKVHILARCMAQRSTQCVSASSGFDTAHAGHSQFSDAQSSSGTVNMHPTPLTAMTIAG